MKYVTIYGERCSGTNYLEELLLLNFKVKITWDYGWKHFFGFNDLSGSDDVLFIGIIRNLEYWVNSLHRTKHHLPNELTEDINVFLTSTFYSIDNNKDEYMTDRNIETGERYKNIFELRHIKNKFLIEKMPKLVKNYCLITYDDLTSDFVNVMNKLKKFGLKVKKPHKFPQNIFYYKKIKTKIFKKQPNQIPKEQIYKSIQNNTELLHYEKILFPNWEFFNINNKLELEEQSKDELSF